MRLCETSGVKVILSIDQVPALLFFIAHIQSLAWPRFYCASITVWDNGLTTGYLLVALQPISKSYVEQICAVTRVQNSLGSMKLKVREWVASNNWYRNNDFSLRQHLSAIAAAYRLSVRWTASAGHWDPDFALHKKSDNCRPRFVSHATSQVWVR